MATKSGSSGRTPLLSQTKNLVQKEGVHSLPHGAIRFAKYRLKYWYNQNLYPLMPTRSGYPEFNGYLVGENKRCFDEALPFDTPTADRPDYKRLNCNQLRKYVQPDDRVVIIAGGYGVTAIAAAQSLGPDGSVSAYEGDDSRVNTCRKTVSLNDERERIDVHHAVVGTPCDIDDIGDAEMVDVTELPEHEVLELDCEGAELEILQELEVQPRVIIVETHMKNGSSKQAVRETLDDLGYEVVHSAHGPYIGEGEVLTAIHS